jgi:hypothetical protein
MKLKNLVKILETLQSVEFNRKSNQQALVDMPHVKNPQLDVRSEAFSFLGLPKVYIIHPATFLTLQILNVSSSSTRPKLWPFCLLAMETLTGLYTKVFTKNNNKTLSPSRSAQLGRSDISFSPSSSLKRAHFDHLALCRRRDAPLLVMKSHPASNAEVPCFFNKFLGFSFLCVFVLISEDLVLFVYIMFFI